MFIITDYKKFESNQNIEWQNIIDDIISKSDYIKSEFDIEVVDRNKVVNSNQYIPYIDLYKSELEDEKYIPFGVYDVCNRQFKLFYSEGKELNPGKYLVIKSDNFFDAIEDVYYKIYID